MAVLPPLPSPGSSAALEGALEVAGDPPTIEIAFLGDYGLTIDFAFLEMLCVKAQVILDGSKGGGGITVAPCNIARDNLTATVNQVEV